MPKRKLLIRIIVAVRKHEIHHLAASGRGDWEARGKTNQKCHLFSLTNTIGGDSSPPRLHCTNWIPCPIGAPPPPHCRPAIMSQAQVRVQAKRTDCSGSQEGKREEEEGDCCTLAIEPSVGVRWGVVGVQSCFTSQSMSEGSEVWLMVFCWDEPKPGQNTS